jgi:hypothetical protein
MEVADVVDQFGADAVGRKNRHFSLFRRSCHWLSTMELVARFSGPVIVVSRKMSASKKAKARIRWCSLYSSYFAATRYNGRVEPVEDRSKT